MDYKALLHDFDIAKKELIDFLTVRNKRNVSRSDKLVNEYITSINQKNYSIKSYKAKIIHNELDCHKTLKEIDTILSNTLKSCTDLFNRYFDEYYQVLKELNILSNKTKDLREFTQENRRQKHDVLLKRNNIEKEYNTKLKELDLQKNSIIETNQAKNLEIKNKLLNSINKVKEKNIDDFQEFEAKLLDCDELSEIKELKEKIKEIRLVGLDNEYDLKIKTYEVLKDNELQFTKDFNKFLNEVEMYKNETKVKLLECETQLRLLNIESDNKDKCYELVLNKNAIDSLLVEINTLIDLINNHNQLIRSFNDDLEGYSITDKLFSFDILLMYYYKVLVYIKKDNLFDPINLILESIIETLKTLKNYYNGLYEGAKQSHKEQETLLLQSLKDVIPNPKKKSSHDELVKNVIKSLNRYYDNFEKELDKFIIIIFKLYMSIYSLFIKKNKNIDIFASNCIVKNSNYRFINCNDYGYSSIEDDDKFNYNNQIENFKSVLYQIHKDKASVNDDLLKKMNQEKESLINKVNSDYEKQNANIISIYNEMINNWKQAEILKEKELKKSTINLVNNAKKFLQNSKKAL